MKVSLFLVAAVAAFGATEAVETKGPVLAVFAHPDDERVIGPLLSKLAREGRSVHRALFTRLDTDRNGQLSSAEFAQAPFSSPPNAAPNLKRFDLNRDGSINLVEYRTATLSNFDQLDTDKDGIINSTEMRAGGLLITIPHSDAPPDFCRAISEELGRQL